MNKKRGRRHLAKDLTENLTGNLAGKFSENLVVKCRNLLSSRLAKYSEAALLVQNFNKNPQQGLVRKIFIRFFIVFLQELFLFSTNYHTFYIFRFFIIILKKDGEKQIIF